MSGTSIIAKIFMSLRRSGEHFRSSSLSFPGAGMIFEINRIDHWCSVVPEKSQPPAHRSSGK